jgi:hypothetical protein
VSNSSTRSWWENILSLIFLVLTDWTTSPWGRHVTPTRHIIMILSQFSREAVNNNLFFVWPHDLTLNPRSTTRGQCLTYDLVLNPRSTTLECWPLHHQCGFGQFLYKRYLTEIHTLNLFIDTNKAHRCLFSFLFFFV